MGADVFFEEMHQFRLRSINRIIAKHDDLHDTDVVEFVLSLRCGYGHVCSVSKDEGINTSANRVS